MPDGVVPALVRVRVAYGVGGQHGEELLSFVCVAGVGLLGGAQPLSAQTGEDRAAIRRIRAAGHEVGPLEAVEDLGRATSRSR